MRYLQVAILGVAFFVGGFAQAVTIEELHELQKKKYAKSLSGAPEEEKSGSKIDPIKFGNAGEIALPRLEMAASKKGEEYREMRLMGLFGVGNDIEAKIAYRGAVIPLKIGMDIDGWVLTSIGDRSVTVTRSVSAGKTIKKRSERLRVATFIREYTPVAGPAVFGGTQPPLPLQGPVRPIAGQ